MRLWGKRWKKRWARLDARLNSRQRLNHVESVKKRSARWKTRARENASAGQRVAREREEGKNGAGKELPAQELEGGPK